MRPEEAVCGRCDERCDGSVKCPNCTVPLCAKCGVADFLVPATLCSWECLTAWRRSTIEKWRPAIEALIAWREEIDRTGNVLGAFERVRETAIALFRQSKHLDAMRAIAANRSGEET